MENNMPKSNILIMIIGTSPMPNLISACTRVDKDGRIYMVCSEATRNTAERLKELIHSKRCNENISIFNIKDYDDASLIRNDICNQFESIIADIGLEKIKDMCVELNYTGGTKALSSILYYMFEESFKGKARHAFQTYLDGEKSVVVIREIDKDKVYKIPYRELHDNFKLKIQDIYTIHDNIKRRFKASHIEEMAITDVSYELYDRMKADVFDKYGFMNFLKKIKDVKKSFPNKSDMKSIEQKSSNLELYQKMIEKKLVDKLDGIIRDNDIIKSRYSSGIEIIEDYREKRDFENELDLYSQVINDLDGKWLEYGLLRYLDELRNEGIIDEVVNSITKYKGTMDIYEVDLAALKNHILYVISVTTSTNKKISMHKLHEVKLRAQQLGGDNVRVGVINLCDNSSEFEEDYKDIWDNELKNTLIISWDRIERIEELLRTWILGGGINEK